MGKSGLNRRVRYVDRLGLLTRALDRETFEAEYPNSQFFYESYKQVLHFFKILIPHGFNLRTCGSILDFGCGSARIIRLYRYMSGVHLVGTDANPECIAWCREQVPGCEFHINDLDPPLQFAKGNDFDLIISLSVFTHIPLEQQILWLQEMKRVLKPNGFLLCTVVGTWHIDAQLGANGRHIIQERERLRWARTIQACLFRRRPVARPTMSFSAETGSLKYSAACSG